MELLPTFVPVVCEGWDVSDPFTLQCQSLPTYGPTQPCHLPGPLPQYLEVTKNESCGFILKLEYSTYTHKINFQFLCENKA